MAGVIFRKGDRVRIKPGTEYASHNRGQGVIIREGYDTRWYQIRFDDGYISSYRDQDLELAIPTSWQSSNAAILVGKDTTSVIYISNDNNKIQETQKKVPTKLFLDELERGKADTLTPILPKGAIFYARRGTIEAVILEEDPGVRFISHGRYSDASIIKSRLAFPYVVIGFRIIDGYIPEKWHMNRFVFYRNQPVSSLGDTPYSTNLMNVAPDGACMYPRGSGHRLGDEEEKLDIAEASRRVRESFWQHDFTSVGGKDFDMYAEYTTGKTAEWERKTSKDPSFVLKIKWPEKRGTVGELAEHLLGIGAGQLSSNSFDAVIDAAWRTPETKDDQIWLG